jgi:hypothetical protein
MHRRLLRDDNCSTVSNHIQHGNKWTAVLCASGSVQHSWSVFGVFRCRSASGSTCAAVSDAGYCFLHIHLRVCVSAVSGHPALGFRPNSDLAGLSSGSSGSRDSDAYEAPLYFRVERDAGVDDDIRCVRLLAVVLFAFQWCSMRL